ncbi:MAG TPA: hypothetical protein VFR51_13920 [Pyrinomonadaceae bacterium]|nr:hypothetical protein [Pyrinomonadaceae bacterium]
MTKTRIYRTALAIACLLTITGIASADTKVKSRQTSGGQTYENTSYIKGKRQRSETNNGQMIVLQQCDLRRNVQIMPSAQAYVIQPYDTAANTSSATTGAANSQPTTKGGVVTSTVTTKDTGERKQMFGYTARHIITTMAMESSPEACSQVRSKMQIDGWYIDAEFALECDSGVAYRPYTPPQSGGCQDRYVTKQVGAAKKGYPVWEKMTMFDQSGAESFSTITEVVEFSNETLDASLFDVPAGYRQVNDFASAFSAPTPTSTPTTNTDENKSAPPEPATKPDPKPKSDPVKKINRALRWP